MCSRVGDRVYIDEIRDLLEDGLEDFETIADDGSAAEVTFSV